MEARQAGSPPSRHRLSCSAGNIRRKECDMGAMEIEISMPVGGSDVPLTFRAAS